MYAPSELSELLIQLLPAPAGFNKLPSITDEATRGKSFKEVVAAATPWQKDEEFTEQMWDRLSNLAEVQGELLGLAQLIEASPSAALLQLPPAQSPSDTFDLTVTAAAKLLCSTVSGLALAAAKTRVSPAATAGHIRNNGKKGSERRLNRDSFSTWLLKQQEAEVAASASWAAGMS